MVQQCFVFFCFLYFFTDLSDTIFDNVYCVTRTTGRQGIYMTIMSWTRNSNSVSSFGVRTDDTHETRSHLLNTGEYDFGCDYFLVSPYFFSMHVGHEVKQGATKDVRQGG